MSVPHTLLHKTNYTTTAMNPWTCFQTYSNTVLVTTTSWGVLKKYVVTQVHYNKGNVKLYFQIQPQLINFKSVCFFQLHN